MITQAILLVVLIGPIILLTVFFIKMYKGLPNKEEKQKITKSILIGLIICFICIFLGLRTPTTEFGRFMSGQDFGKCIFAPK